MNGTGVEFSVEEEYVDDSPVAEEFHETDTTIIVADLNLVGQRHIKNCYH